MAANRVLAGSNGDHTAKESSHTVTVLNPPATTTEGQDVAEIRHMASSAGVDIRYAIKQLKTYRDIGRALDAMERVEEALKGIAGE